MKGFVETAFAIPDFRSLRTWPNLLVGMSGLPLWFRT